MNLEWSALAIEDRARIFDWIEADDVRAAVAVDERIWRAAERLIAFPALGRPGRVAGTRELVIARTSYIAAYLVGDGTITILRVLHSAQLWPEAFS